MMAQDSRYDSFFGTPATFFIDLIDTDLSWPFGDLKGVDKDDIRETAYKVFFIACSSSPGFRGDQNAINFYSNHRHQHHDGDGTGTGSLTGRAGGGPVVVMSPTSRIKRALGLEMVKKSPTRFQYPNLRSKWYRSFSRFLNECFVSDFADTLFLKRGI